MLQKLGPHVIKPTAAALQWARRSHAVKCLDDMAAFQAAPDHAIRVFRHFFRSQDVFAHSALVVGELLNALGGYRHPKLYVEVFNEIPKELTAHYADLLDEVVPMLHAAGVKVIGPCWGTGDYEQADWDEMRRRDWCGLDAVAVHCYWGMPHGLPVSEVFTPWNALRYRTFWRAGDPPLMITECGRDRVNDLPGSQPVGNKGWRNDGLSDEDYVAELETYESYLQQDPQVLAAFVFTAGPSDAWRAYDTDDVSGAFVVSPAPFAPDPQPASEPPPPPPPPDPPPPPPTPTPPTTTAQLGRGLWVWYVSACGDAEGIVASARRADAAWVAIKGGDGPSRWAQLDAALVDRIADLAPDLAVWGWTYGYGGHVPNTPHGDWTVDDEIAVARSVVATTGVDGFVVDVEAEWAERADPAETGRLFAEALRQTCDEHEIPFAYAPIPIVDNFPRLPWVQFNAVCDYVMPQLYAGNMVHITVPAWTLDRMLTLWYDWRKQWEDSGLRVPVLAPVFDAYDLSTTDDVRAFEAAVRRHPDWGGWSYWSMQHAGDARLAAMAESDPQENPMPLVTLSAADRAAVLALCDQLWTAGEALKSTLARYGQSGQSVGYWQGEAAKGVAATVKDACGLNS